MTILPDAITTTKSDATLALLKNLYSPAFAADPKGTVTMIEELKEHHRGPLRNLINEAYEFYALTSILQNYVNQGK